MFYAHSHVWLFRTLWTPTALLCPWDFPSKNTGVGCHSSSRGSSQPRDLTCVSCISCTAVGLFYHWATGASLTYVTSNLLNPSTSYILNHVRAEEIKFCSKSHSYFQWCWPAKPILFAFPSYLFHLLKAYSIYYRRSVHGKCPTHVFEWKKEKCPREYYQRVENVSPEIFSWV